MVWIRAHALAFGVEVKERTDLSILALQGPKAKESLEHALPGQLLQKVLALKPFGFLAQDGWRIARTGYTGEDGFEFMIPNEWALRVWGGLLRAVAVSPVGLVARDTLRLEAGLNLYGNDMDEKHNPLESGVGWTVDWEPMHRDFIGRPALEPLRGKGGGSKRVGLVLRSKGVLRDRQRVIHDGVDVGYITSGGYSPTLEKGIALARVKPGLQAGMVCEVEVRGRHMPVDVVRPPFVKRGASA